MYKFIYTLDGAPLQLSASLAGEQGLDVALVEVINVDGKTVEQDIGTLPCREFAPHMVNLTSIGANVEAVEYRVKKAMEPGGDLDATIRRSRGA